MHLRHGVVLVMAVAIVIVGWPRVLGGAASYVVVSGVSMEPTYETGDLVVTRQADEYEAGDVIAFRTAEGDVIHRIIGGNADEGFRTQGDNVARPDPYLPRPADIRGKALFHVPAIGAWGLRLVRTVPAPLLAAGAILLAVGGGSSGRRRRRRSTRRRADPVPTPTTTTEDTVSTSLTSRPRIQVAGACVVVAFVVLPSAFLAWRAPTTTEVPAEEAAVRHETDVTVTGIAARPSSLYPDGRSEPIVAGDDGAVPQAAPALLRNQIDELLVTVEHTVVGAPETTGAGRIDVVLRTGRGFEFGLNGVPMTAFTGTFEEDVTVRLDAVEQRFERYLREADLDSDTMTIEVRPLVATDDDVTVRGGPVVLDPSGDEITVEGQLRSVTTSEGESVTVAASAPLVGLPLPVPVVRIVGTALVAALLTAAAWLLRRELRERPDLRIGLLHASLLVDIEPDANVGGEIVRVTSIAELARLAKRDQRTILHQERSGGQHHYLVPDGELTYEYVVDLDGVRARGLGIEVPDDASALLVDGGEDVQVDGVDEAGNSDVAVDAEPPADPIEHAAPVGDSSSRVASDTSSMDGDDADEASHGDDADPATTDTSPARRTPTRTVRRVRRVVDLDALATSEDELDEVAGSPTPDTDEMRDYLPVTPADLPSGRVVVVEDFTELLRIWMQDNTAPGRLQQRRLARGGMRYSVVRNGREFVYEARQGEDVATIPTQGAPGA